MSRRLRPLDAHFNVAHDLFTVVSDPSRRYAFSRDQTGRVVAFDLISVGGPGPRSRRTG